MSDGIVLPSNTSTWVMMSTPSPSPTATPWPHTPARPPRPFQHTKLILGIIGGFLGAVAILFLLTMFLHVCRRKKGTRRNTVNAETMTDHEMNHYVRFPISSHIITSCPEVPPEGHPTPKPRPSTEAHPHPRPSTLPLHSSKSSSSAFLGSGDYEALLPATVSVEEESEAMYEPMCSSADSEEYYLEPTPVRIQMVIANAEAAAKSSISTLDGWNIPVELYPAKEEQDARQQGEDRLYENVVIGRKTNPDELYI